MTPRLLSASSISGTKVRNLQGDYIGDIQDLMIDWKNGKIVYAVLSFGGFLGLGDKLFAIPLESFTFESPDHNEYALLDVSKEKIENAPGFDKDVWPQNADYAFIDSVYSHYDYKPYSLNFPNTFKKS